MLLLKCPLHFLPHFFAFLLYLDPKPVLIYIENDDDVHFRLQIAITSIFIINNEVTSSLSLHGFGKASEVSSIILHLASVNTKQGLEY